MTDLITIPNVGMRTKASFLKMGITCVEDLVGKKAEDLYKEDCRLKKMEVDKCQLYLFRMCIYYAENSTHEEEKLKWWYWKDHEYKNGRENTFYERGH